MLFHLKDAVEFGEHYYPYVPGTLFTKIRKYNLNFFTYDFPKTIPKSFSQRLSYDKF